MVLKTIRDWILNSGILSSRVMRANSLLRSHGSTVLSENVMLLIFELQILVVSDGPFKSS